MKIFSYDETGPGLITSPGRRIILSGVRPVARIQRVSENYYIYGAVGIPDGRNLFSEFPRMNTDCFQNFIEIFSEEFPDSMNVLLTDNAGIHKAERSVIPQNIRLIFLPAYSPELNPIERFWQHIKRDIKGKIFSVLREMKDYVADILKKCSEETVASLTGFSYISTRTYIFRHNIYSGKPHDREKCLCKILKNLRTSTYQIRLMYSFDRELV